MRKIEKQLLKYILKIDDVQLMLLEEIPEQVEEILGFLLKRYNEGEPLEYITNEVNFMGLDFFVDQNVLIPRPETELLVEEVLKYVTKETEILDLCTGSGCILISILKLGNCIGTGVDISEKALQVAKRNVKLHGVKAELRESDMLNMVEKKYDIIVSNPPYIETKVIDTLENRVKNYEPYIALDGGGDGLDYYRTIRESFASNLKPNGMLFLEIGHDQGLAIEELFKEFDIQIKKDYAGHDRIAIIKL